MEAKKLTNILKGVQMAAKRHSPEILTGIGIAGMITTAVMAVRATPKALQMIDDAKEEKDEILTPVETVQAAWKCYIPAAVVGGVSIACLVGASSVNARRNAALATAYALSESTLKEYQEKVVEKLGKKKEQEVRDDIAKDYVDRNPVSKSEVIITEKGNTLCFDKLSGRYFRSDIDKLKAAVNELNRQMRYNMYISVNELYDEIGLSHTDFGDMLGWNIDRDYIDLQFSSQLAEDGTPCLVVAHRVLPQYEFTR